MKKFTVQYDATLSVEVEAEDWDEAREKSAPIADEADNVFGAITLPPGVTGFSIGTAFLVLDQETEEELLC